MPSMPGISTSSRPTSGRRRGAAADDLVAAADLGHHLEVGLEAEQRGQRAAHQGLVVGEQQPDPRDALTASPGAAAVGGRGARGCRRRRRPLAQAAQAVALGAGRQPAPSSLTSTPFGAELDDRPTWPALCRITLVTPSRTIQANSARWRGSVVGDVRQVGLDPGGGERRRRRGQLAGLGQRAARRPSPARRRAPRGCSRSIDSSSARARAGSTSSSRSASSALTVTTVSEWPRMSCRSRAKRSRSATRRARASSSSYCSARGSAMSRMTPPP